MSPKVELYDLLIENPDLKVFTSDKKSAGLDNVEVCDDPLKTGTLYVMRTKKAAIIITDRLYMKIKPGSDVMNAIKLAESIRQDEYFKSKT